MDQKNSSKPSKRSSPRLEKVNKRMAIDKNKDYSQPQFPEYEERFREKLLKAGLEPIQIEIMVLRFVYDLSFSKIAKELQIVSTLKTISLYEDASKTLKKRGFDE